MKNEIIKTVGISKSYNVNIPTKNGVLSTGDIIGGVVKLPNITRTNGGTAIINSFLIKDEDNQSGNLYFLFFNKDPNELGVMTNDNPLSWGMSGLEYLIAKVEVASSNYIVIDNKAIADIEVFHKILQTNKDTKDLWMLVVVKSGTPNYTNGIHRLSIRIGLLMD